MVFMHKLSKRLAQCYGAVAFAWLALTACEASRTMSVGVPSIARVVITPDSVDIDPGQTQQFQASGRDAAGSSLPASVTWTATAGTISAAGVYTADTTITDAVVTAVLQGGSLSATARVRKRRVVQVILRPGSAALMTGSSQSFTTVGVRNTGDTVAVNATYSATGGAITNGGVYTAGQSAGTYRVIAVDQRSGLADTAAIALSAAPPAPVASVTVTPAAATVAPAGTLQFTAILKDAAGNTLSGRAITWTSSNPATATVSATGLVTGASSGTVSITATSESQSGSAAVTVSGTSGPPPRVGYYASPTGTSGGDGSASRPWDLATALAGGNGRVQPGDTIWLRGGTYRGAFQSTVSGTTGAPVVVRQVPGERAIIDGAGTTNSTFHVAGDWSVFWGFEVINSDPTRTTSSTANNVRPNSVVNYASHTKYIALVIHDGGVAFYTDPAETDVEIVGCILYNNGWQGPDRGHGHGLYLKSVTGPVVARDNVLFNQFGYGVHGYTNAGSGKLINIRLEGNVAFNNGTLSNNSTSANILLGGADYADGDVLADNMTYFTPGAGGTNVEVGYGSLANGSVALRDNRFVGGTLALKIGYWNQADFSGNTIVGSGRMVDLNDNTVAGYSWGNTRYFQNPLSTSWTFLGVPYALAAWQAATGLGLTDLANGGTPVATEVIVRPNPYEAGRANIIVYNWGGQGAALTDLTGVLPVGAQYEIRNVQNLFGAPVITGTYGGGAVSVPLAGVQPPAPIGMGASPAPATGADFQVFVLTVVQ